MRKIILIVIAIFASGVMHTAVANSIFFTGGAAQSITTCAGAGVIPINALLAVSDSSTGNTDTWTLSQSPTAGAASVAYTSVSAGGAITPSGLTYSAAVGFSGTDSFSVMVSNGTDIAYTTIYITVEQSINLGFNLSDAFASCSPLNETCTNTTLPITSYTYQWRTSTSGAIVSTSTDLNYLLTANGTTNITLIATSASGCSDSLTQAVTIQAAQGYLSYSIDTGCAPVTATIYFIDTNGTWPSNFTWVTGDDSIYASSTASITHVYQGKGIYHPSVIISSVGCAVTIPPVDMTTLTDSIQVFQAPAIRVTPAETMICSTQSAMINVNIADTGRGYSWTMNNGLNATSGSTVMVVPTVTTTYRITGTNTCGSDTATAIVNVIPQPDPVINYTGCTLSTAIPYTTYQWYKDGIPIAGATNTVYEPTGNGIYSVEVTNEAGCSAIAGFNFDPLAVSGVNKVAGLVTCYPNPAHSVLYIQSAIKVNASITTMDGRVIVQQDDAQKIDLTSVSDGIYLINIYNSQTGQKVYTDRIVKTRE